MLVDKVIPSPNFFKGRAGYKPEAIVIHVMAGSIKGADQWFSNPDSKVSAHYGISMQGEVHQYVDESNTAWHAGRVHAPTWKGLKPNGPGTYINPNFYTIGIEHEGKGDTDWPDAMYKASANMIRDICVRYLIPLDRNHIVGHHEIFSLKICPGQVDLDKLIRLASVPNV